MCYDFRRVLSISSSVLPSFLSLSISFKKRHKDSAFFWPAPTPSCPTGSAIRASACFAFLFYLTLRDFLSTSFCRETPFNHLLPDSALAARQSNVLAEKRPQLPSIDVHIRFSAAALGPRSRNSEDMAVLSIGARDLRQALLAMCDYLI